MATCCCAAAMAVGSIVMQLFLLVNVLTVSRACLAARDPIPVEPDTGLRVAFLTTIVPDKEPLEMAERTLRAAKTIVYGGQLDLWLLDEGNSDAVKDMCRRLGVRHFSRKDRGHLELDSGTFADKTKHGNHNRWLWEHAGDYDVVMFVDTDHVPLPIMAERLLGYFRDPEVAFVVTPQFYGNQENRITRWAESAQYLFHSVIQRAGNRRGCAMLVGTNVAVRTSAIKAGYVASITEDMATSLKIHATRSPTGTGPWRSVYTPDLVAVGEGPSSWTDFFGQQTRWSAGTYDALMRQVWRVGLQAPARRDAALRPDADLLPVGRHRLDHGHHHQRLLPGLRDQQPADQRGLVAHLLRRRRRHAVPAVPVHAAAQREPARARGVLRALRHGGLRADRADLRPAPDQGGVPPQARVQRDGQGLRPARPTACGPSGTR